jgi:hypothetical protein
MHVPENTHGDPGNLDVGRLLAYAQDIVATTTLSMPVVPAATAQVAAAPPPPPVVVPPALAPPPPPPPREVSRGTTPVGLGPFPLPAGHWFGVESRDARVHSGFRMVDAEHVGNMLDALRARGWRSVPDGTRYTPDVERLIRAYQADAHLRVDGRAGVHTWTSIATSNVR